MSRTQLDLILHPVRIRILITMGTQQMTAQQLARALPDVAQATLYRHIKILAQGEILQVIGENPIRGTIEKVYALSDMDRLNIKPDELPSLSKEEHMRYFTTFAITLVQQFAQYLQRAETVDAVADGLGYHSTALYMTDEELRQFSQDLSHLVQAYLEPSNNKARVQRLFSTIFMPSGNPDEQID